MFEISRCEDGDATLAGDIQTDGERNDDAFGGWLDLFEHSGRIKGKRSLEELAMDTHFIVQRALLNAS